MQDANGLLRRVAEDLYYLGRFYQDKRRAHRPLLSLPAVFLCVAGSKRHAGLSGVDALFHVGSLSKTGTFDDIQAQISWLSSQARAFGHEPLLCLGGEHDLLLDPAVGLRTDPGKTAEDLDWQGLSWLRDKRRDASGGGAATRSFAVYGHPRMPGPGRGAFHYPPVTPAEHHARAELGPGARKDDPGRAWYDRLPPFPAMDIVLANTPPAGHLDGGAGCPSLLDEIWRRKPQLLVCTGGSSSRRVSVLHFDSLQRRYEGVILAQGLVRACLSLVLLCWGVILAFALAVVGRKGKSKYPHWCRSDSTTVVNLAEQKEGEPGCEDACVVFFDSKTYDCTVRMGLP